MVLISVALKELKSESKENVPCGTRLLLKLLCNLTIIHLEEYVILIRAVPFQPQSRGILKRKRRLKWSFENSLLMTCTSQRESFVISLLLPRFPPKVLANCVPFLTVPTMAATKERKSRFHKVHRDTNGNEQAGRIAAIDEGPFRGLRQQTTRLMIVQF